MRMIGTASGGLRHWLRWASRTSLFVSTHLSGKSFFGPCGGDLQRRVAATLSHLGAQCRMNSERARLTPTAVLEFRMNDREVIRWQLSIESFGLCWTVWALALCRMRPTMATLDATRSGTSQNRGR